MTKPTQKFTWKDRDKAAFDLLNLVYHAPNSIARDATHLLQAIRSPMIITELVQIADDEQRDIWERIYALRAIANTPSNWYLPHLADRMKTLLKSYQILKQSYTGQLQLDLLSEIRLIVAHNPVNQDWFFELLDILPYREAIYHFLSQSLSQKQPSEFRRRLLGFLVEFLNENQKQLTPSLIEDLVFEDEALIRNWLDENIDAIIKLMSLNTDNHATLWAAEGWSKLRASLMKTYPDFSHKYDYFISEREQIRKRAQHHNKKDLPDHKLSPAYEYISSLYVDAVLDDNIAYSKLIRLTKRWHKNIPMSAVATRFLKGILHKPLTIDTLCYLIKYANDTWDDRQDPRSPIRIEAGEILKNIPSPYVWDVMVDAFFMRNGNVLSGFLIDWITHLTDMLDGIDTTYCGIHMGSEYDRRWFRVLSEIGSEELDQLKIR